MTDGASYRPSGPIDPVAEQIAAYFGVDPVWQGLRNHPVAQTRAAIKAMTPVTGEPALAQVEDFQIKVAEDEIRLRLYRDAAQPKALIAWAHGGGFALGSIDEIDNFCRALVVATGCAVVSIEYRLAPEHPFPTPLSDVIAATRWIATRIEQLAGAGVPLVLGGDSAGANLATVASRKLAGEVPIAANVLAYPNVDAVDAASLRTFETPFLTVNDVGFFLGQYAPNAADQCHPDFAPLLADNLGVLPPTLLLTAEHDILTGQCIDYAARLREAGVAVREVRYPGMIHGFVTMDAFFAGAAGDAMREIGEFIDGLTDPASE